MHCASVDNLVFEAVKLMTVDQSTFSRGWDDKVSSRRGLFCENCCALFRELVLHDHVLCSMFFAHPGRETDMPLLFNIKNEV